MKLVHTGLACLHGNDEKAIDEIGADDGQHAAYQHGDHTADAPGGEHSRDDGCVFRVQ